MKTAKGLIALAAVLMAWPTARAQVSTEGEANRFVSENKAERLPNLSWGQREAVLDLLGKRVENVDWRDTTFEAVIDWLKDEGGERVNIVPKWGPLQIENIGPESPINLTLNNTTVAEVLNEVMDQLSGEGGEIHYRGIGNKLTISTKQDFERKMYVRVYDVTDLLFRIENFGEDAPLIDLQNAGRSSGGGGGGGGGGGQSVFQGAGGSGGQRGASSEQEEQENEERLMKFRELIEQTIAPESWDLTGSTGSSSQTGVGGGRGRIRVLNRSLVVLNTIEVHEMIAGGFSFGE